MDSTESVLNKVGVKRELLDTVKARKLAYYGHTIRKHGSCLEKEIMQGTMPGARRRGKPRTAWIDNINTWTGLPVQKSIKMTVDRHKWRKYVHAWCGQPSDRGRLKNRTELFPQCTIVCDLQKSFSSVMTVTTRRVAVFMESHCNIGSKKAFPTSVLDLLTHKLFTSCIRRYLENLWTIFCVFVKTTPYGKILKNFVPKVFTTSPIDVVNVIKFVRRKIGEVVNSLPHQTTKLPLPLKLSLMCGSRLKSTRANP